MPKETILFLPIGEHVELRIAVQARFYNGIDSDPRTLTREPSYSEILIMIETLKRLGHTATLSKATTLDYPERP